jgi:predicted outer membrane repeat protein
MVSSFASRPPPSQIWYVNPAATGGNTGHDWTDAFNTAIALDDAITAAAAKDTIFVAAGTYRPMTPGDGFAISKELSVYGGFAGGETSPSTRAGLFTATILDGTTTSPPFTRLVTVTGVSTPAKVVIDGFQITNGKAGGATGGGKGGGIYCEGSNLELGNILFFKNEAVTDSGGGLYFTGAPGFPNTLNIKICEFRENKAENKGGAMYGTYLTAGDVVNTLFSMNSTIISDGGAVYLENMGTGATDQIWFTNGIFWKNLSTGGSAHGGGMALGTGVLTGANVKIINCTLVLNRVPTGTNGHALDISAGSLCEIHNSIFWHNPVTSTTDAQITGTFTAMTYSCVQNWQIPLPHVINTDPLFRSLVSPGTLHLLGPGQSPPIPGGSPCIDHADWLKLPFDNLDVNGDGLTTNQRMPVNFLGSVRDVDWPSADQGTPAYTYVDMGAYEKQ